MAEITAVSIPASASAPNHPDHARWVKDRTMGMEAAHARRMGIPLEAAEKVNAIALERLAAKKREGVKGPKGPSKEEVNEGVQARRAKSGVKVRDGVAYGARKSACNWCGRCLNCKREQRTIEILKRAREGDKRMHWYALSMTALMFAFQKRIDCKVSPTKHARKREVAFSRMKYQQRINAFMSAMAQICDWSEQHLGRWRP